MNSPSNEQSTAAQCCEVDENLNRLREITLFAGLPIELQRLIAYLCERDVYPAGDMLFSQGDDDAQAIYILGGSAELIREEGQQRHVLREFTAGDFIGGMSLLGNSPRLFSLAAKSEVSCFILTRDKFAKAMEQFPEVLPRITRSLVMGINDWEKRYLKHTLDDKFLCAQCVGVSLL